MRGATVKFLRNAERDWRVQALTGLGGHRHATTSRHHHWLLRSDVSHCLRWCAPAGTTSRPCHRTAGAACTSSGRSRPEVSDRTRRGQLWQTAAGQHAPAGAASLQRPSFRCGGQRSAAMHSDVAGAHRRAAPAPRAAANYLCTQALLLRIRRLRPFLAGRASASCHLARQGLLIGSLRKSFNRSVTKPNGAVGYWTRRSGPYSACELPPKRFVVPGM